MNDSILIENYKNYDIKIELDDSDDNPRDWDNYSTMALFHNRYNLGDKIDFSNNDFNNWQEMKDYILKEIKPLWITPVYLYEHSGIKISMSDFNDRWDSSSIGFIYLTRENIEKMAGYKRITKNRLNDLIESCKHEFKNYDSYIRGEVYRYGVKAFDDYCGGFYSTDNAISEAKFLIDYKIKQNQLKKNKKIKSYINNKIPLIYRFK